MPSTEMQPVAHIVHGPREEVIRALDLAIRQGRLLRATPATPIGDGLIRVEAVMWEPIPAAAPQRLSEPRSARFPYKVTAWAVTAVLGALVALGALTVALVRWVMDHAAIIAGTVVVLLGLALALAALAGRRHACSGLHCGGCGR